MTRGAGEAYEVDDSGPAQSLGGRPARHRPDPPAGSCCASRMVEMEDAIGVQVLTFDRVYAEVLNAAGESYPEQRSLLALFAG